MRGVRGGGSSGVGVRDGGGESRVGDSVVVGWMGFLRGGFDGCWGWVAALIAGTTGLGGGKCGRWIWRFRGAGLGPIELHRTRACLYGRSLI